jgi:SulP family sulfate permease
MYRLLPFLRWLPELRQWEVLRADLAAGFSLALVLIPHSMANAKLAELPPVYGLYAAFLPPMMAALFGSSRHLTTGPVALSSLISAAAIQQLAPPESEAYIAYAIVLAMMVGLIRLALGLLRLGIVVNLLSSPVIVGFTNAAALIIATSQLPNLFGVRVEKGEYHYQTLWRFWMAASTAIHWETVAMAIVALGLMLGLRYRFKKLPQVLIASVVTTLVAWMAGYGGSVVGGIPPGLPAFEAPAVELEMIPQLATGAITLTLIGFMEAISIAKTLATQTKQRLDINQELIGQGMANLAGSFFQSYVVSGSFARSAINFASGARTGFSSVVASLVAMAFLLWLTPLLYFLPQATLAAIIVASVLNLIRVRPLATAWRVSRQDGLVGALTFVATLGLAPDLHLGIALGVGLSLVLNLYRTMRPHVAFLARHMDGTLREAGAGGLLPHQQIAILRFDGRLYFGASSYFEDSVLETVARVPELRYLIVDAEGINQIDASGEQALRGVVERLRAIGIDVYFTRAKRQFTDALERTGAMEYIGRDHFFRWNQHALEHLWARLEPEYKTRCPLNTPYPRELKEISDEYYI